MNDSADTNPDIVARYVFDHYRHLMTPAESLAHRTFFLEAKAADAPSAIRDLLLRQVQAYGPEVQALVAKGPEQFRRDVCERILRNHPGEVFLNRCPMCAALTRTPRARLCVTCGHTWYE